MTLSEAWALLGRDSGRIIATLAGVPREQRVAAAEKVLEKARRMAAKASAPHHPDVGGDPAKFKRVWDALKVIEEHTAEFKSRMAEVQRKIEERAEKGPFIEIKK